MPNEGGTCRPASRTDPLNLTPYHAKFIAHELTRRCASDSVEKLTAVLSDAQVDLNPLTVPVEKQTLAGKTVYNVAAGLFMICLERELTLDLIRAIAERKPERVVLLDEGFAANDQLKANAVQTFKTKGVTSFKTV